MEKMKLKPLFDTVFVKRTCQDYEKKGGIILPANSKEEAKRVYEGEVLFVGPGVHHEKSGEFVPTSLKEGDKILFGRFIPNIIQLGGEDVYILKEAQIFAAIQ